MSAGPPQPIGQKRGQFHSRQTADAIRTKNFQLISSVLIEILTPHHYAVNDLIVE
jgi:hypothetical protein